SVGDPGSALALHGACPGIVRRRGPGSPRICIVSANSWGGLGSGYHGNVVFHAGAVQASAGARRRDPPASIGELVRRGTRAIYTLRPRHRPRTTWSPRAGTYPLTAPTKRPRAM